jgi:hypothetical protein
MMTNEERKVMQDACTVYAGLTGKAREAFVNQLSGMAFVVANKDDDKSETDGKDKEAG